jgi:hypothetical protein
MVAVIGVVLTTGAMAACVEEEPDDSRVETTASATATPTVHPSLLVNGQWAPEVLSYAKDLGVTPEEAARRLSLQFELGPLQEQFRGIVPERLVGVWLEHEPEFKLVVAYTGDDVGLEAAHDLAATFPGLVEVRTGMPYAEADWERAHETLRETAIALGLLRREDMLSSGTDIVDGFLELHVTRRPASEAAAIENALTAALGVPVRLTVHDEIPPFGTQPAQASADDPIARTLPANVFHMAATRGTLVREGNCLYLVDGPRRDLLSFPYRSEWDAATDTVVIGGTRLSVGDTFFGGGSGFSAADRAAPIRWGTAPDPACDAATVWFLSPDIRVE